MGHHYIAEHEGGLGTGSKGGCLPFGGGKTQERLESARPTFPEEKVYFTNEKKGPKKKIKRPLGGRGFHSFFSWRVSQEDPV